MRNKLYGLISLVKTFCYETKPQTQFLGRQASFIDLDQIRDGWSAHLRIFIDNLGMNNS